MRIKRIHAADMRTAIERVREELGPDAVIVSTRTLGGTREERRKGMQGVEVVAGLDERAVPSVVAEARAVVQGAAVAPGAARAAYALEMAAAGTRPPGLPVSAVSVSEHKRGTPVPVSPPSFPRVTRDGEDEPDLDALVPALAALAARKTSPPAPSPAGGRATAVPAGDRVPADRIPAYIPSPHIGEPMGRSPGREGVAGVAGRGEGRRSQSTATAARDAAARAFALLCAAGLTETVTESALEQAISLLPPAALTDAGGLLEAALARVVAGLPAAPALTEADLAGRTVFFTGPAGVGKTTALLKAAMELRRGGADVGIIGADVSHLGGPEQLLRYGQVLRLPVEVAYSPDDLARLLSDIPPARVTLVDTPACAAGSRPLPDELAALLAAAPGATVALTVAAGTAERELERLSAFSVMLSAAAVVITKLDEAPGSGAPLNVLAYLRLPPLLCSIGRDILADLRTSTAIELAVEALEAVRDAEESVAA